MSKQMRANALLVLTAMIWGMAFAAQASAAEAVPPLTFNALRMMLAAAALLPVAALRRKTSPPVQTEGGRRTLVLGGTACGVMLTLGSAFQQLGITMGTGAGKAGFITALYIVMVPLAGLFFGRRAGRMVWIAVALSAAGLYFLCMQGRFSLEAGDGMLVLCAVSYTGHILVVDHFSRRTDCLKMSCIQFAACALLCLMGAVLFEQPSWEGVKNNLPAIVYAGIFSGAVGYTLQMIAQRDADPAVASLLMSLESVFAVIGGWLLLGDQLSARELFGCGLMMLGIVLAQWPQKEKPA